MAAALRRLVNNRLTNTVLENLAQDSVNEQLTTTTTEMLAKEAEIIPEAQLKEKILQAEEADSTSSNTIGNAMSLLAENVANASEQTAAMNVSILAGQNHVKIDAMEIINTVTKPNMEIGIPALNFINNNNNNNNLRDDESNELGMDTAIERGEIAMNQTLS
jgi:hypothetical protein